MCSHFLKMMENYQGDLADIVRATTAAEDAGATAAEQAAAVPDWQFSRNSITTYPSEYFGDPFTYMRDPLTPHIDTTPVSELFYNSNIIGGGDAANNSRVNCGGGVNILAHNKVVDDEIKRPSNIFSRMLQISPNAKLPLSTLDPQAALAAATPQREVKNPPILVSNNGNSGLQISSPRNTGIKRRKSQAKKVVCIPAPAPANSRSTGEVVPSDLWAWRKYGQKPIKGSPYPRGYYRCSSSKGCSARKQVERSRTDPNMLVITYNSEHNHPWPTQRNALAGSTRSQAAKNKTEKPTKETPEGDNCGVVKEEAEADHHHFESEFDEGLLQTYNPTLPDSSSNQEQDNFFADLGEIPLNLFGQGFSRNDLDPFALFEWTTTTAPAEKGGSGEESGRK